MINNHKIMVVVPAFNEAELIGQTLSRIPDFVDQIVVVDDCSSDETASIVSKLNNTRIKLISHPENRGVGAAIVTGYRYCIEKGYDLAAVMAGDDQMAPDDLEPMIRFMLKHRFDYVKGNRFKQLKTLKKMPPIRIAGSLGLNLLTKIATGYYHIGDPQSGYTVITAEILKKLPLDQLFPRYGYPNDLLGKLGTIGAKVSDFPIAAVYKGEASGIKPLNVILPYSRLLFRIWLERMKKKWGLM